MTQLSTQVQQHPIAAYQDIQATMTACREIGESLQVALGLNSPHHGVVMMLTCLSEGLSISDYARRYHNDGTMRAAAIQAEFLKRGGKIAWQNLGDDGQVASAEFSHPTLMPSPTIIQYTIEDARRQVREKMDKDGSNWKTNPGAMLRAALIRKAVKIIDPGVITGHDEFSDIDDGSSAAVNPAAREARRQELLQGMNTTMADDAPDPNDPVPGSALFGDAPQIEEPQPEQSSGEAEPVESGPDSPCTEGQLNELAELGCQFQSLVDPARKMDLQEVAQGICRSANVASPELMTRDQADRLIAQFKGELAKKGEGNTGA